MLASARLECAFAHIPEQLVLALGPPRLDSPRRFDPSVSGLGECRSARIASYCEEFAPVRPPERSVSRCLLCNRFFARDLRTSLPSNPPPLLNEQAMIWEPALRLQGRYEDLGLGRRKPSPTGCRRQVDARLPAKRRLLVGKLGPKHQGRLAVLAAAVQSAKEVRS